jgi:glycosyltransferase involved in cell wall biosynthesis
VSGSRPARLLAYTDSDAVGGAELALGYMLGELPPGLVVGVLATDRRVAETIVEHRPGTALGVVRAPEGSRDRAALWEHIRAIRAFAPDVVHANQAWPWACGYGELAALLARGTRVLAVDHLPVAVPVPRRRLIARRLLARRLHAHVSVGERAARLIEEIVGLRAGSVAAVANGVPPAPEPAAAVAVAGDGVVFGSLGRLTDQKGYDMLVRALPGLARATLLLVGDGPERGSLERLAAELGVGERVQITGWTADARARLPALDVFVLPSRWEGMPLSILEAMHAGLPVLAADVGSVADAVRDGETGYLVARDDQVALEQRLANLLEDGELRRRMGEAALQLARSRFDAAGMARRYQDLYRRLAPGVQWDE